MLTNKRSGFSLIELLVALTIFSIAMLGMTPLLIGAIKKNNENSIRDNARTVLSNTATTLTALDYSHAALGKMSPQWLPGIDGCDPEVSVDDNASYNFLLEGHNCFLDSDNDKVNNFFDPLNTNIKVFDQNNDDIISFSDIFDGSDRAMDHPGNNQNDRYYNTDNDTSRWHNDLATCETYCELSDCCVFFPKVTLDNLTSTGLYFDAIDLKETVQGVDYYKSWSIAVLDRYDTKVVGLVVYWWSPYRDNTDLKKNYHQISTIFEKSMNY